MSLDVYLETPACQHCGRGREILYTANVTHNLNTMAQAAGIYEAMWRPDEHGLTTARQLIEPLRKGLAWLTENRAEAEKLNPENGWGDYDGFVQFIRAYLAACEEVPHATVSVSR